MRYQIGRLSAYAALGATVGASGGLLTGLLLWDSWVSVGLGLILAAGMTIMALRLLRPGESSTLVQLGKTPKLALFSRIVSWIPRDPFWLGAVTALLPCGALYSALLIAASAGSAVGGAAAMSAFAFSSGLGLLSAGWVASHQNSALGRQLLGTILILGAVAVVARPIYFAVVTEPAACHQPSSLL